MPVKTSSHTRTDGSPLTEHAPIAATASKSGLPKDVEFLSGDEICRAWLYVPDGSAPPPVIVMAHGLGGTREMRLDAFAARFCDAGYACLVFDYRHFGASDGEPRHLLDIDLQLADWAAAIAYARQLSEVDTARVILWGTSFSGGHVIETAARDGRVAAVISQSPFTDGQAPAGKIAVGTVLRIAVRAVLDVLASRLGLAPVEVASIGRPGDVALITTPDAYDGYMRICPPGTSAPRRVAARIALRIRGYRPGQQTANVKAPILFCICASDRVVSPRAALTYAGKAPRGQTRTYDAGHFDIYVGEVFERTIKDQIAFLHVQVPIPASSAA